MEQSELILRVSVSEVDGAGAERLVLFVHLRTVPRDRARASPSC